MPFIMVDDGWRLKDCMRGVVLVELVYPLCRLVGKRVLEMELLCLASGIACIEDAPRCHVAIVFLQPKIHHDDKNVFEGPLE